MIFIGARATGERDNVKFAVSPRWQIVAAAAFVACSTYFAASNPLIAFGIVAVALAVALPTPTFLISVLWILLCRPGSELLVTSIGSLTLTEIDLLPLLATIAAVRIPTAPGVRQKTSTLSWLALLAWPIWYLLRTLLPHASSSAYFGSVAVDLRSVSMYLVFIPIGLYVHRRGAVAGIKLVCYGAYVACAIAIAAWLLLTLGFVDPARTTFVNFLSISDVRPGGELLIAVTAVMLLLGQAPLAFGSRVLSVLLLIAEVLVSQTLSLALAIAAGFVVASLLRWGSFKLSHKLLAILAVLAFAGIAFGGLSGDSRFNLASRIGEDSAQYRVTELEVVARELSANGLSSAIGVGPGSVIAVNNPYTHAVDLKRDTHSLYSNIVLKTGLTGLALFLVPMVLSLRQLIAAKTLLSRAIAGSLVAVLVLSLTVPFVWTAGGFSGLAILYVVAANLATSRTETARTELRTA